jgi:hypothetical protein
MSNEAATVVASIVAIDESEWDMNSLEELRKEAEFTAARLQKKAS